MHRQGVNLGARYAFGFLDKDLKPLVNHREMLENVQYIQYQTKQELMKVVL